MIRALRGDNIARFHTGMTLGETYAPAMEISTEKEAIRYFEDLIELYLSFECNHRKTREEAEAAVRENLGYYAGYYDNETRERVERLFHCSHPVFGSIAEKGPPTFEEAFEMGVKIGEEMRRDEE